MFFFFNDTATTEIYTLSLHDALPISRLAELLHETAEHHDSFEKASAPHDWRSEEHTSELQSRQYLVCRLLLEKKKNPYSQSLTRQHFRCSNTPPSVCCPHDMHSILHV